MNLARFLQYEVWKWIILEIYNSWLPFNILTLEKKTGFNNNKKKSIIWKKKKFTPWPWSSILFKLSNNDSTHEKYLKTLRVLHGFFYKHTFSPYKIRLQFQYLPKLNVQQIQIFSRNQTFSRLLLYMLARKIWNCWWPIYRGFAVTTNFFWLEQNHKQQLLNFIKYMHT